MIAVFVWLITTESEVEFCHFILLNNPTGPIQDLRERTGGGGIRFDLVVCKSIPEYRIFADACQGFLSRIIAKLLVSRYDIKG